MSGPDGAVPPGRAAPAELAGRIAAEAAERTGLLVALDHDGTLSPIAPRPELASLAPGADRALAALTERADVAIVSGRGLDDLAHRFAGLPVTLVSEHGLRRRDATGATLPLAEPLDPSALDGLRARLATLLPGAAGAEDGASGWLIEDKGVALAVHHRLVGPDDLEPTLSAVRAALDDAAGTTGRIQAGKAVLELRPAGAEKGAALRTLAAEHPGAFVVMIGDDVTDEPALAVAEELGGIGVLVDPEGRPSAASVRVDDPDAVVALLDALAAGLSRG